MSEMADEVQRNLIKAIDRDALFLPTLPEVALKIRLAAEDTEISIAALSKVIGSDTALSARLIKVVNSPLLRPNFEVSDVNTAITRLALFIAATWPSVWWSSKCSTPSRQWSNAKCVKSGNKACRWRASATH